MWVYFYRLFSLFGHLGDSPLPGELCVPCRAKRQRLWLERKLFPPEGQVEQGPITLLRRMVIGMMGATP